MQIGRDLLLIITSTADDFSGGTNIDDLEPPKWVLVNFSRFQALTHISRVNSAKITGDRPRQPGPTPLLMKFSAYNVDFNILKFQPLGSRSPQYGGFK